MTGMEKMERALRVFRALDNELPTQTISVFLFIAKRCGPTGGHTAQYVLHVKELPEPTGLSQSAINRATTYLADFHWKDRRKVGLKLITIHTDPLDRRQRIVRLTAKGHHVVNQLEDIFNG